VLNRYFIRPTTVDRIRASWIGDAIERYVALKLTWVPGAVCFALMTRRRPGRAFFTGMPRMPSILLRGGALHILLHTIHETATNACRLSCSLDSAVS
jgi:hypothetical protein